MNSDDKLPLSAFMPNHFSSDPHAPFIATAGKKNDSPVRLIDKNEIVASLKTIHDPELPVNIYDLGLIYDIRLIDKNDLKIKEELVFIVKDIVEKNHSSFAFPSQSIYIEKK